MAVDLVQTSCGFAVPFMDFVGRPGTSFAKWSEAKGADGVTAYWDAQQPPLDRRLRHGDAGARRPSRAPPSPRPPVGVEEVAGQDRAAAAPSARASPPTRPSSIRIGLRPRVSSPASAPPAPDHPAAHLGRHRPVDQHRLEVDHRAERHRRPGQLRAGRRDPGVERGAVGRPVLRQRPHPRPLDPRPPRARPRAGRGRPCRWSCRSRPSAPRHRERAQGARVAHGAVERRVVEHHAAAHEGADEDVGEVAELAAAAVDVLGPAGGGAVVLDVDGQVREAGHLGARGRGCRQPSSAAGGGAERLGPASRSRRAWRCRCRRGAPARAGDSPRGQVARGRRAGRPGSRSGTGQR